LQHCSNYEEVGVHSFHDCSLSMVMSSHLPPLLLLLLLLLFSRAPEAFSLAC